MHLHILDGLTKHNPDKSLHCRWYHQSQFNENGGYDQLFLESNFKLIYSFFFFPNARVRIQALNSLGAGPFSHTIKLKTKPLPPDPPRLECAAYSSQTLKLKWGEGTAKALTDSIQYHLQMEDKNGRLVLTLL